MNFERLRAFFGSRARGRASARGLLLVAVWVCAMTAGTGRLAAQDAGSEAAYKELIEQALSEFKHKNWPEARILFTRAHELNPNARTLRGMGIVSFEMRDYLNGVINLKAALEDTRQPLTDAQRKECETLLTRARAYVGVYTLKLEPQDAQVLLDGDVPTRDEENHMLVPFGEHTLSAKAPGYQDGSTRLNVQGGERGEVSLVLQTEPAPVAVAVLPVGAANEPAQPVATSTNPYPAEPATSRANDGGFRGHGLKYTWVALGASAVFGGTAAVMWTLGDKELKDLDDACQTRAAGADPCTPDNTSTEKVDRFEKLTNASLGLSAAALVAAGVLMGLEWPRERNLSVGLSPQALFVRGAF